MPQTGSTAPGAVTRVADLRSEFDPSVQSRLSLAPAWRSFLTRHGGWKALWNETTGTPHRAFGPSIELPGYVERDEPGRMELLRDFLAAERDALGIDPADLILRRSQAVGALRYVSFAQAHRGVEALFSEVELRVHEPSGRVMALGVVWHPGIGIGVEPAIGREEAAARAAVAAGERFGESALVSVAPGDDRLFILPAAEGDATTGAAAKDRLVRRFDCRTGDGSQAADLYVDAVDGSVARYDDRILHGGTVTGSVSGDVRPVLPTDALATRPFPDLFLLSGLDTLVSDSLGLFRSDSLHQDTVTARLRGRWIYVSRVDSPSARQGIRFNAGDTIAVRWTDSNSHAAERTVYWHATFAHNAVKSLDPAFTALDTQLRAAVNLVSGTCNAFWNGTSINFLQAGPGCVNAGESPATIYHEYAHAVNDRLYAQAGAVKMMNKAAHEAMADVFACLLEDTPLFPRGFWGPGTISRSLDNTASYPLDLVGQEHRDGLILGGAFWDLREATSRETAWRLSHFAKWGAPDDSKFGAACAEWFVEVLVADDDDGDLGNGTPNFAAIGQAFDAHGIGTTLFLSLSFSHTPYPSTADTGHSYVLAFDLSGGPAPGAEPPLVVVRYSTDHLKTLTTLSTIQYAAGRYLALIPPQSEGTMVHYSIEAFDSVAGRWVEFPPGAPEGDAYAFLVGRYVSLHLDELESPAGWTAGAAGDDATAGLWEWGEPQATFNGWRGVQPGSDRSPTGVACFVTGASAGAFVSDNDVDGGRTTLLSPVYDLSVLRRPVIRYHRWYSNNLGEDPRGDRWRVEVTGDGGATWAVVEDTDVPSNFWKRVEFRVGALVPTASAVMVRFIASDEGTPTLVEALVDDFEILDLEAPVVAVDGPAPGDPASGDAAPREFSLGRNYPNPFNGATVIPFELAEPSPVTVTVFDILGRVTAVLIDGRMPAGRHAARWEPGRMEGDGRGAFRGEVPGGVYYYVLTAGTFRSSGKLVYLK